MRKIIKILTVGLVATIVTTGCASTKYYHVKRGTGGFSRTKLNNHTYEVRVFGIYPNKRKEQFLLRRCAQITLGNGKRYFAIFTQSQSGSLSENGKGNYAQAIIKILSNKSEGKHNAVVDAVTVVKQTNKIANGKLSAKARKTFNRFVSSDNQ